MKKPTNEKLRKLAETKKGALRGAILKWKYFVQVKQKDLKPVSIKCSLCTRYIYGNGSCFDCPLKVTEGVSCFNSKSTFAIARTSYEKHLRVATRTSFIAWRKAAQKMLSVLESLE